MFTSATAANLPDVIFEYKTLKTNAYETIDSKAEVIEITRVLDRFKKEKPTWTVVVRPDIVSYLDQMPIGMVESRNEDIKCLVSPFTNK